MLCTGATIYNDRRKDFALVHNVKYNISLFNGFKPKK